MLFFDHDQSFLNHKTGSKSILAFSLPLFLILIRIKISSGSFLAYSAQTSKYFDVHMELQVPDGDAEGGFYGREKLDPQMAIGLGVTPIHLKLFGRESLALGLEGGVGFGNSPYYGGESRQTYLGPRITLLLTEKLGLVYTYKSNMGGESAFRMRSLAVSYRW